MADNAQLEGSKPLWVRVVVNTIYVLGAIAGLLVGAYGVFIFVVGVIMFPGFYVIGLGYGLPLMAIGGLYLAGVLNLMWASRFRKAKYRWPAWTLALLGLFGILFVGYFASLSLRGL